MRVLHLVIPAIVLTAGLAFSESHDSASAASPRGVSTAEWTPATPPAKYDLTVGPNKAPRTYEPLSDQCTTSEQLDCVESISAYINGKWVNAVPAPNPALVERIWTIEGLKNEDGKNRIDVSYGILYNGMVFLSLDITGGTVTGDSPEKNYVAALQPDVKFRATIRTSWVLPTHVKGNVSEAKYSVEKLATSGASRITMEGIPVVGMIVFDESTLDSETGKGASDTHSFNLDITDGRFYFRKECVGKPAMMTADNAFGPSFPIFTNGNLDLRLKSPHFRSDGKTVHYGLYEAAIPMETAKCLWGDYVNSSSQFSVEVIDTGGEVKTATRSVSVVDDVFTIKASGFTYSSPTIRVTLMATPTTTTTPTTTPISVSKPSRPTDVSVKTAKRKISVSIPALTDVTYTATATKGSSKKTLRCTKSALRVTCTSSALAKGSWKVTVIPKNSAGTGTAYSRSIKVV